MSKKYIVNKEAQNTWEHEVHNEDCSYLPSESNQKYLWYYNNCSEAIKKAKETYNNVDWCYWCSKACHTR